MKSRVLSGVLAFSVFFSGSVFADITDNFSNQYKQGDKGPDVKLIQKALSNAGTLNIDEFTEYFGEKTKEAVYDFQIKNELGADGIIGRETLDKMEELKLFPVLHLESYRGGLEHDDVLVLQKALDEAGFFKNDEYTTYFGVKTEKAVMAFQKDNGLVVDGICGSGTIKALVEKGLLVTDYVIKDSKTAIGNLGFSVYKNGDSSPDVKVLQQALASEVTFDFDEFTNYYGDITEDAVKEFQAKYELEADGVCGSGTIKKLKELGLVSNNLIASRSAKRSGKYGEYLKWSQVKNMYSRGKTDLLVEDFYTGSKFYVRASYGSVHIDVEPLTRKDSEIVRQLWGGKYGWARRPVLVYMNNRVIAASLNGMPHAGREDTAEGVTVSNRSGGFGRGYNYDRIKGNGISGHLCLHFRGSHLHKNDKSDPQHQHCVRVAAGLE